MLDEDLKEEELSDSEEPLTLPDMEQEESQPTNVSNKFVHVLYFDTIYRCFCIELHKVYDLLNYCIICIIFMCL